jgi:hypothetical protein
MGSGPDTLLDSGVENLRLRGRTGWSIRVIKPPTAMKADREMFRQDVLARALVADIALVFVEALRRGEQLWDDA